MEAWHARAIQVETSMNSIAKWLYTTISDVPLGGTRMQLYGDVAHHAVQLPLK